MSESHFPWSRRRKHRKKLPTDAPAQADGAPGQRAAALTCYFCGERLRRSQRYCTKCARYQPTKEPDAAFATEACRVCGEHILEKARRCKYCNSYQRPPRSWVSVSSDTIALFAALISLGALGFTSAITILSSLRGPRSETTVAYSRRSDGNTLVIRATNFGSAPSQLTRAFVQLRAKCKLRRETDLCIDPPAQGPFLVLEPEKGRIDPGDTLIELPRVEFSENELPPAVANCARPTWESMLKAIDVCVEVSVRERQQRKEHCRSFAVSASSPSIRTFVGKATRCPPEGT